MQRLTTTDNVVYFTPEDILALIREKLKAEGVTREICGVQVCTEQAFESGQKVSNEVPRLNVILSDAGG